MCLENIFSHSVADLLTILIVSFTEQKFLILIKSNLPAFSCMGHAFGVVSRNSAPRLEWF